MAPFWIRGKYFISSILFLMFILEMVIVVWAARDHDHSKLLEHFGRVPEKHNNEEWQSDRDRVRYWRWKNRNRLRNRRARMGLALERFNNKQPGQKKNYKPGDGSNRKYTIQIPPQPAYVNITETMESCCPTVFEVIEPTSGRNRADQFVELYRDDVIKQYFYEYSCQRGIKDQPCRFLENRHSKQSRCIQQRTYTYALIRTKRSGGENGTGGSHVHHHDHDHDLDHNHNHDHYHYHGHGPDAPTILLEPQPLPVLPHHQDAPPWRLDYISLRSGCACEIVQTKRKRMFKMKGG